MSCTELVPEMQWWTQGHSLTHDMRIIQLGSFDIILGADWLESHSPMRIHWRHKKMRFTYQGKRIVLQGLSDQPASCKAIGVHELKGLLRRKVVTHMVQLLQVPHDSPLNVATTAAFPEEDRPPSVRAVLQQFAAVFSDTTSLPPPRTWDHTIPLIPGAQPVNTRVYRFPPDQKSEIERQLTNMLSKEIIRPSSSPFASSVLLVRKKDATWRFCIDYRKLNAITVKNKHPMPVVEELLDELSGSCWFYKLDLRSGYHQIRVAAQDIPKTAFRTHHGLYEFLVMPFGLTNAPASFHGLMNDVFAPFLRKFVLVFMDDILIYSDTLDHHIDHLRAVLQVLADNQLFAKASKCSFAKSSLEYLGHIISDKGVATDPAKILAVQQWPIPANLKDLRGFLGLTGYYRRFIHHNSLISRPLTQLLKKNTPFLWTPTAQTAFDTLKQALTSAPVLALPNFSKEFVLETDASDFGIGDVLMQDNHPIAFLSQSLSSRNAALSTYEKECLAITLAVGKWRPYLQTRSFTIRTDHKSLLHLTEQRIHTRIQQKALLKLMDLDFSLVYKKGSSNLAADALSRQVSQSPFLAISLSTPSWLSKLTNGYADDPQTQELLA